MAHRRGAGVGGALIVALAVTLLVPGAPSADEFITVPVIINILKNSGIKEEDAKKAVEKASEILKAAAKIQFQVLKTEPAATAGDNGDGQISLLDGEGSKQIKVGEDEVAKTDNKKGLKITFAKRIFGFPSRPDFPGISEHRKPTVLTTDRKDAEKTGETIAHETLHTLTLAEKHTIDGDAKPPVESDAAGHAGTEGGAPPNVKGKTGDENIMAPSDIRKGRHLTDDQLKKIRKDGKLKDFAKGVTMTPVRPGEKLKQQFAYVSDGLGDQRGEAPAYFDLSALALSSELEDPAIHGQLDLGGLVPRSGPFLATYRLLFDADHDSTTGVNDEAGFVGIEREVRVDVGREPEARTVAISGAVIDRVSGRRTSLPARPRLVLSQRVADRDVPGVPTSHQLLLTLPKALLRLTAAEVPVGVVSQSPRGIHDVASTLLDLRRWMKDASLRLRHGSVRPGQAVPFEVAGLQPLSPFHFLLDQRRLFGGTLDPAGGATGSFNLPVLPFGETVFLNVRDATGEFAFNVVRVAGSIVTGPGPGGRAVRVFRDGRPTATFLPYVPAFAGGVSIAVAPLGGAGAQLVTGAGPGDPPHVRAFTASGAPRATSFLAYDRGSRSGVRVAAGDFERDGRAEVVTGPGPGLPPRVRVIKLGADGNPVRDLASFLAYDEGFRGGVNVAAGDVDGDGVPEIITGPGAGAPPEVRVYRLQSGAPGGVRLLARFLAFEPTFTGGVHVAAGPLDAGDRDSIVVGAGPGRPPLVRVAKLLGGVIRMRASFLAYPAAFRGGVFVAAGNVAGDSRSEIITGPGPGIAPQVRAFTGNGVPTGLAFLAYGAAFHGGVAVAALP